jgi:cytochrome P450
VATTGRKYELYGDEFRSCAYETFAEMREHDPVVRQPGLDGTTPIWFVTRYDDAVAVLLDDERFVRDAGLALTPDELAESIAVGFEFVANHMLNKDGDDHRRLRRLVSKAFTPRMVEQLRPRIQEIADGLIDTVEARGEMDLMEEFAFPVPITVIAELLGVPAADRDRFRVWSDAVVTPAFSPAELARFKELMDEFVAYLRDLFDRRRTEPTEDLISALLQAEDGGDTLSEEELFSMVILLITAGHETTVGLIGNGVLALLGHPDQIASLEHDPGRVIEEVLRYDGAVERALPRWAAADVTLGGHTLHRGELVIVILASADRDPARFAHPDAFDVERETETKHIAFGRGSHYCLGAPLARLEGEIALTTLFRRLPGVALAASAEERAWRPVPLFRSLASLRVAWPT